MPKCARSAAGKVSRLRPLQMISPDTGATRSGNCLEQRALAGAVRPDHRDELPALHLERNIAQGTQAAIGNVKRAYREHDPSISCRETHRSPPSWFTISAGEYIGDQPAVIEHA